ncbi:MAG: hypothetical protein F9K23_18375 [Bacteroidetes bacterium]|nr:MAG: hypothetical protein F9K23_18375 [Bacteroidota bacterium]
MMAQSYFDRLETLLKNKRLIETKIDQLTFLTSTDIIFKQPRTTFTLVSGVGDYEKVYFKLTTDKTILRSLRFLLRIYNKRLAKVEATIREEYPEMQNQNSNNHEHE